jgi:NAD+ kinase
MKIGLHGKFFENKFCGFIQQIFDSLHQHNIEINVSDKFNQVITDSTVNPRQIKIFQRGEDISSFDYMLSIGGDGTFLDTITYIRHYQIPILGINTGRLGFLASTTEDSFCEAIEHLYQQNIQYENRTLIHLDCDPDIFNGLNFGLNEFAILKKDTSSMIVVHTYIDDDYLNSYWADGLIVATPTGSSGYSLSCGGPFILPLSHNFVITPISPHNLNVRPMVVDDNCVIKLKVEGRGENFLASLDSRSKTIDAQMQLTLRKEKFTVKIVKLNNLTFFDTLRQKLHWGLDNRNWSNNN